ncbi:MAG TPA: DUF11 domain-containing protein, partial [Nitrososphaera sp.]|nr:DUF11 domain-containing protein [Nitrososphaera sp.]
IVRREMKYKIPYTRRVCPILPFAILLCVTVFGSVSSGQDKQTKGPEPPGVELLKLSGSKPNLTFTGEGITSIKTSDLFKIGMTRVKPFDRSFKIELPVGYTLFNNLAYMIDSDAVFSGPNDFTFKVPSATTTHVFEKLHILYAGENEAEPEQPRWIDATVEPPFQEYWERYLPKAEFEKRLADFSTRTIHALMEEAPRILVVAVKDSSISRDRFVADIGVSATPDPPSVMEGREITYTFRVTNNGPDTATSVTFSSYVTPDFISLKQSQGVCRWDAHNIYCNLGEIPQGVSATITFHGRCLWNFYYGDRPSQSGGMDATPFVHAAEGDPNSENNMLLASAPVIKDPNQAPVVSILTPKFDQLIVGPEPNVKIVLNAYDPDGSISEVQIYNEKQVLGNPKPTGTNTYEFNYEKVPYGQHFLQALVKDNLGRPSQTQIVSFHVNGQAKVELLSPQPNQVIIGPVEELVVRVRASGPARQLTKVTVHNGIQFGGIQQQAQSTGLKDEYAATFKNIGPGRVTLYVDVVDDAGITTLTYPIEFKITQPPDVQLHYVEGEYQKEVQNGTVLPSATPVKFLVHVWHSDGFDSAAVTKLEIFANEKPICHYADKNRKKPTAIDLDIIECTSSLAPGKYTLSATVTDSDGANGKSKPIDIVVR